MTVRDSITAARLGSPHVESDGTALFEFRFGKDDPVFAGHFPGRPILPGVFQLEIVRMAAEWALNHSLALREIRKAKFLRPVLPGETVRLELKLLQKYPIIEARAVFAVDTQPAGETHLLLWRNE